MKVADPQYRSWLMSKIRSKDTKPELAVRSYLFSRGIRFRKNVADLPGKPDVAIKRYKMALQVLGCFWHGHEGCSVFRLPTTNTDFWKSKIERNRLRDRENKRKLEAMGFTQLDLWECEVKSGAFIQRLDQFISSLSLLKNQTRLMKTKRKHRSRGRG